MRREGGGASDPFALRVFVPGIIGAGLLVSLVVVVGDAVRRATAGQTHKRHASAAAGFLAGEALQATAAGARAPNTRPAFRSRPVYAALAALFLAGGSYTLVGSYWNFVDQPWARLIAWIWALSVLVGLSLLWLGVAATALAFRDRPPAFVWPLVRRTPLGSRAPSALPERGSATPLVAGQTGPQGDEAERGGL